MNLDQKRDVIFCALAFACAVGIGGVSFGYDFDSSYFPRLLAIFLGFLAATLLLRVTRPTTEDAEIDLDEVRAQLVGFAKVFGAVLGYVGLMLLTSYTIGTVLFLVGMMVVLGERKPLRLLLIAGLTTAVLSYLFFQFLGVTPPEGLLAEGVF